MAIITISRQAGSLGDEIAREAAQTLGYEYIEKVQISEILSRLGFSLSEIDKYDEKKPSVWQTLSAQKDLFANYIKAAVYELASRKDVVIVGRGGQVILKDIPGVLHVRITAPYGTRVNRLMEQRGYPENDVQRILRQRDRDSAGYLNTYFDANPDDTGLYDLIINTRTITLSESVELIAGAAGTVKIQENPPKSEQLFDLSLKHKAIAAILKITGGGELVNIEVEKGVVTLTGIVESSAAKNDCQKGILDIQGIVSVNNDLGARTEDGRIF